MWPSVILGWAILALLINLTVMFLVGRGAFLISRVERLAEPHRSHWPRVSLVIPARNEERDIRQALQSVLEIDYPDYEVIAVNDRSEDATGSILEGFANEHSRLRVVHVESLPDGWLGKNHAMHVGAGQASGELILFTDADVVQKPRMLRRCVDYLLTNELDHLAGTPYIDLPSWFLKSLITTFMIYFAAYLRPWKARDPRSSAHIGIGAFNLVRADAYRRCQGHAPIAMRPDDDVRLGRWMKEQGCQQDLLNCEQMMHVPWYASVGELVRGLEKNAFAGVDYRLAPVVLSTILVVAVHLLPFAAVLLTSGAAQWLAAANILVLLSGCAVIAVDARLPLSTALGFPLAVATFLFILWRTTLLTLWQGGIRWRGTFYSLSDLRGED